MERDGMLGGNFETEQEMLGGNKRHRWLVLHLVQMGAIKLITIHLCRHHYSDVIKDAMASQITSLAIVFSTVYSGADQRKHQSSASLAFVRGIHR